MTRNRLGAEPWEPSLVEMEPESYLDATWAPVWTYGIHLALPLAFAIVFVIGWARLRRRAEVAQAREQTGDVTPAVGQTIVRGIVAETEGGPGVRVTIEQIGTQSSHKRRWTTTWREIGRRVETSPFLLTTNGVRIRVEPNARVKLVDEIDRIVRPAIDKRFQIAELVIGEPAIVLGQIVSVPSAGGAAAGGYRAASQDLVMRPGPDGTMLVSTDSLAAPLRRAASVRAISALTFVAVIVIAQVAAIRYHVALLGGHVEPGVVLSRREVRVKTKKGFRLDHSIVYRVVSTGVESRVDVAEEDWPKLLEGRSIPVWVSFLNTTLGGRPTEHAAFLTLPIFLLIGVIAESLRAGAKGRGWYDGAKLVDRRTGMLDDDWVPPPAAPAGPPRGSA
jgi:hypothetical protein